MSDYDAEAEARELYNMHLRQAAELRTHVVAALRAAHTAGVTAGREAHIIDAALAGPIPASEHFAAALDAETKRADEWKAKLARRADLHDADGRALLAALKRAEEAEGLVTAQRATMRVMHTRVEVDSFRAEVERLTGIVGRFVRSAHEGKDERLYAEELKAAGFGGYAPHDGECTDWANGMCRACGRRCTGAEFMTPIDRIREEHGPFDFGPSCDECGAFETLCGCEDESALDVASATIATLTAEVERLCAAGDALRTDCTSEHADNPAANDGRMRGICVVCTAQWIAPDETHDPGCPVLAWDTTREVKP